MGVRPPGCLLFVSESVCVGHFQLVAVFVTQELLARDGRTHGLDRVVHLIESNLAACKRTVLGKWKVVCMVCMHEL